MWPGIDPLGRPVLWVMDSGVEADRQQSLGFDQVTGWLIAYGAGPVGTDGRLTDPTTSQVVTAIDTAAPPKRLPTPAPLPSPCLARQAWSMPGPCPP